jgi:hypothetical protein
MRINFERSGGFTGMAKTSSFNLDELPENVANNLRTLVEQANFSKLPNNLPGNKDAPDQFTYTITVQSQEWQHTIVTGEASAPEEIRPLIEALNQLARSQRLKS